MNTTTLITVAIVVGIITFAVGFSMTYFTAVTESVVNFLQSLIGLVPVMILH